MSSDLLDNLDHKVAVPGRIKRALLEPEKGTLPISCAFYEWNARPLHRDLQDALPSIARYLKYGAGVKVNLSSFQKASPKKVNWHFTFDSEHPDFAYMTEEQRKFYTENDSDTSVFIPVADSMEESNHYGYSIIDSWIKFIRCAVTGYSIVVDLSQLRPSGSTNKVGLSATGALGTHENVPQDEIGTDSFLSVYQFIAEYIESGDIVSLLRLLGQLCRVIRRGGSYKNGIVCTSMHWKNENIRSYLQAPLAILPGGQRKAVRLTLDVLDDKELCNQIVDSVNRGETFLEKVHSDPSLFLNVCSGIYARDRGACLLTYANLGRCATNEDITEAYVNAMQFACELHTMWRKESGSKSNIYRTLESDQQVGVGWMGLANLLAMRGISYKEFAVALHDYVSGQVSIFSGYADALSIVRAIEEGYRQASEIAEEYGIERFATIEPNQQIYTYAENKDLLGFTACRNIDPPFSRREKRVSDTVASKWFNHGKVETLSEVPHDVRQSIWEDFQTLAEVATNGRTHAQSFDLTKDITLDWFEDFMMYSSLVSTYYNQTSRVNQSQLDKGTVLSVTDDEPVVCNLEVGCVACGE